MVLHLFSQRKQKIRKPICKLVTQAFRAPRGLPADFTFPGDSRGERDGLALYGRENASVATTELCEILWSYDDEDRAEDVKKRITCFFQERSALAVADHVQVWFLKQRAALGEGDIFELIASLLLETKDIETLKFCLTLLELYDTNQFPVLRDMILKLAYVEEFTLFSLFNIKSWPDGNHLIWNLAITLRGWGKIHAVEYLEPQSMEIEQWLLWEGFQNSVSPAYSALTCAVNGDLRAFLQSEEGTARQMAVIHSLIDALLDERRCVGLSGYDRPMDILALYLEKVAIKSELTLPKQVLSHVEAYLERYKGREEMRKHSNLQLCRDLLMFE